VSRSPRRNSATWPSRLGETGAKFYRISRRTAFADPLADLFTVSRTGGIGTETFLRTRHRSGGGELVIADPDEETAAYLRVLAGSRVFSTEPKCLSGDAPTRRDILQDALDREKESVVFYSSLRQAVTSYRGKEMLERITREELHHLQVLARELEASS
jgi:hypothetical protein